MRRGGVLGVVQPGRVVRRFVEQRAACDSLVKTGAVVFVFVIAHCFKIWKVVMS